MAGLSIVSEEGDVGAASREGVKSVQIVEMPTQQSTNLDGIIGQTGTEIERALYHNEGENNYKNGTAQGAKPAKDESISDTDDNDNDRDSFDEFEN